MSDPDLEYFDLEPEPVTPVTGFVIDAHTLKQGQLVIDGSVIGIPIIGDALNRRNGTPVPITIPNSSGPIFLPEYHTPTHRQVVLRDSHGAEIRLEVSNEDNTVKVDLNALTVLLGMAGFDNVGEDCDCEEEKEEDKDA